VIDGFLQTTVPWASTPPSIHARLYCYCIGTQGMDQYIFEGVLGSSPLHEYFLALWPCTGFFFFCCCCCCFVFLFLLFFVFCFRFLFFVSILKPCSNFFLAIAQTPLPHQISNDTSLTVKYDQWYLKAVGEP